MPEFNREVEIDSPVEKVWEVLTNPRLFPEWFPGVDSVSNVKSSLEGVSFDWMSGDQKGQGNIINMNALESLEIVTQLGDDKDSHLFELEPSGGFFGLSDDECKVQYTLDTLSGNGILGKFISGGNPKDMIRVKNATHALRKLVESAS